MIEGDREKCVEWLEAIESESARDAFRYLVGASACLRGWTGIAQFKGHSGPVRDFRLFDKDSQQAFALIVNKASLLFYFRAPAVRSGRYSLTRLSDSFSEVNDNSAGEWTVRVSTLNEATRLWHFLALD